MNLVGKILTVLIFVMSLVFMSFSVAVYATHKNWKDVVTAEPGGLAPQLAAKNKLNQELSGQKERLEQDLAVEKSARDEALTALENENEILKKDRDEARTRLDGLNQKLRDEVAEVHVTHKTLEELRKQVDGLRTSISTAQKQSEEHFKEVVRLTDALHTAELEKEQLENREKTLKADHAKATAVLRKFGLKAEPTLYADQPPEVHGIVTAVPRTDLIEIKLGSDDGLQVGHKLQVFRRTGTASTYVGRVEVVKTDFDKAVCKVDSNYRQSDIQKGDRVASRFQ